MRSKLDRLNPWFIYPGAAGLALVIVGTVTLTFGVRAAGWLVLPGLMLISLATWNVIFFRGLYAKS